MYFDSTPNILANSSCRQCEYQTATCQPLGIRQSTLHPVIGKHSGSGYLLALKPDVFGLQSSPLGLGKAIVAWAPPETSG